MMSNSSKPINIGTKIAVDAISTLGVTPDLQQRIGAFAICWGLFESTLENTIWALQDEDVKGERPSTDKSQISDWLETLSNGSRFLSAAANHTLEIAAECANNLLGFRHALFHGHLIPGSESASFIRNPCWRGEIRRRETSGAHINEKSLDMAIEVSWILFEIAFIAQKAPYNPSDSEKIESMQSEAERINKISKELQNI